MVVHYSIKIPVQLNLSLEKVCANPTSLLPGDIGLPAVYFGSAGVESLRLFDLPYSFNVLQRVPLSRLPLWSSGQSFWLQIQRSRVRSPALPDFLSSSGSGTGSTQPREVKRGAT